MELVVILMVSTGWLVLSLGIYWFYLNFPFRLNSNKVRTIEVNYKGYDIIDVRRPEIGKDVSKKLVVLLECPPLHRDQILIDMVLRYDDLIRGNYRLPDRFNSNLDLSSNNNPILNMLETNNQNTATGKNLSTDSNTEDSKRAYTSNSTDSKFGVTVEKDIDSQTTVTNISEEDMQDALGDMDDLLPPANDDYPVDAESSEPENVSLDEIERTNADF